MLMLFYARELCWDGKLGLGIDERFLLMMRGHAPIENVAGEEKPLRDCEKIGLNTAMEAAAISETSFKRFPRGCREYRFGSRGGRLI